MFVILDDRNPYSLELSWDRRSLSIYRLHGDKKLQQLIQRLTFPCPSAPSVLSRITAVAISKQSRLIVCSLESYRLVFLISKYSSDTSIEKWEIYFTLDIAALLKGIQFSGEISDLGIYEDDSKILGAGTSGLFIISKVVNCVDDGRDSRLQDYFIEYSSCPFIYPLSSISFHEKSIRIATFHEEKSLLVLWKYDKFGMTSCVFSIEGKIQQLLWLGDEPWPLETEIALPSIEAGLWTKLVVLALTDTAEVHIFEESYVNSSEPFSQICSEIILPCKGSLLLSPYPHLQLLRSILRRHVQSSTSSLRPSLEINGPCPYLPVDDASLIARLGDKSKQKKNKRSKSVTCSIDSLNPELLQMKQSCLTPDADSHVNLTMSSIDPINVAPLNSDPSLIFSVSEESWRSDGLPPERPHTAQDLYYFSNGLHASELESPADLIRTDDRHKMNSFFHMNVPNYLDPYHKFVSFLNLCQNYPPFFFIDLNSGLLFVYSSSPSLCLTPFFEISIDISTLCKTFFSSLLHSSLRENESHLYMFSCSSTVSCFTIWSVDLLMGIPSAAISPTIENIRYCPTFNWDNITTCQFYLESCVILLEESSLVLYNINTREANVVLCDVTDFFCLGNFIFVTFSDGILQIVDGNFRPVSAFSSHAINSLHLFGVSSSYQVPGSGLLICKANDDSILFLEDLSISKVFSVNLRAIFPRSSGVIGQGVTYFLNNHLVYLAKEEYEAIPWKNNFSIEDYFICPTFLSVVIMDNQDCISLWELEWNSFNKVFYRQVFSTSIGPETIVDLLFFDKSNFVIFLSNGIVSLMNAATSIVLLNLSTIFKSEGVFPKILAGKLVRRDDTVLAFADGQVFKLLIPNVVDKKDMELELIQLIHGPCISLKGGSDYQPSDFREQKPSYDLYEELCAFEEFSPNPQDDTGLILGHDVKDNITSFNFKGLSSVLENCASSEVDKNGMLFLAFSRLLPRTVLDYILVALLSSSKIELLAVVLKDAATPVDIWRKLVDFQVSLWFYKEEQQFFDFLKIIEDTMICIVSQSDFRKDPVTSVSIGELEDNQCSLGVFMAVLLEKYQLLAKLLGSRRQLEKLVPILEDFNATKFLNPEHKAIIEKNIYFLLSRHDYYMALALSLLLYNSDHFQREKTNEFYYSPEDLSQIFQLFEQYFKPEESLFLKVFFSKLCVVRRKLPISPSLSNVEDCFSKNRYLLSFLKGDLETLLDELDPVDNFLVWNSFSELFENWYRKDQKVYDRFLEKHLKYIVKFSLWPVLNAVPEHILERKVHPFLRIISAEACKASKSRISTKCSDEMDDVGFVDKELCPISTDDVSTFVAPSSPVSTPMYDELWLSIDPIIHFVVNQQSPQQVSFFNDKDVLEVDTSVLPPICHYANIPLGVLVEEEKGKIYTVRDKLKDLNNGVDLLSAVHRIRPSQRRIIKDSVNLMEGHPHLPFYVVAKNNCILDYFQFGHPFPLASFAVNRTSSQPPRYGRFTRIGFINNQQESVLASQYDGSFHMWDCHANSASVEDANLIFPTLTVKSPLKHVLDISALAADERLVAVVGPNIINPTKNLLLYDLRSQPTLPAASFITGSSADYQPRVVVSAHTGALNMIVTGGLFGELVTYDFRNPNHPLSIISDAHCAPHVGLHASSKFEVTSLHYIASTKSLVSTSLSGLVRKWDLRDKDTFLKCLVTTQYVNRFLTPSAYFTNAYHLGHPHVRSKQHYSFTWKALQLLQQHTLPLPPATHTALNQIRPFYFPFSNHLAGRPLDTLTVYASGDDGAIRKFFL